MAQNTDFGFMRPEDDGPVKNFFKRLFTPQQGLVGQVPALGSSNLPQKQKPLTNAEQMDAYENERIKELTKPGLFQGIRERQLKKAIDQGEIDNPPFKPGFNREDATVKLPRSFNYRYLQYMQQPGFIERLGREMYGPSYKYGSNPENDKQIDQRYGGMLNEIKNTKSDILNVGFMPYGGKTYTGSGEKGSHIQFVNGLMALNRPTYMHEHSHAMYPKDIATEPQNFYEKIPGTEAEKVVQERFKNEQALQGMVGAINKHLQEVGLGEWNDDTRLKRNILEKPQDAINHLGANEIVRLYSQLPKEKRSPTLAYNPEAVKMAENVANKKMSGLSDEASPTEVRARATALRDALIQQGMQQNRQYTKEKLEKAMKNPKFNDMGSYNDLKKEAGLTDDQIIYLLNNLAQAPQRQGQYQALRNMV